MLEWILLKATVPDAKDDRQQMKIYMLVMLISAIVGLSYLPIRVRTKQTASVRPDSLAA
jgi:hypothetical protein